jgi:glycosyltransferase involved in cell wall biosynthesis
MTIIKDRSLPKISVITPVFNGAQFIESAISSVINQAYPNIEYIIIDGGSIDGTDKIIKKYLKNISYYQSRPDHGQYDAINIGMQHATGDILCWLNSDDVFLPNTLHMVGQIFKDFNEVEWISTLKPGGLDANGFFTGHGNIPGFSKEAFLDGYYVHNKKRGHLLQQESTFWRKALWDRCGANIPEKYKLAGDYALWCLFIMESTLYGVDYPISAFRQVVGQRSADVKCYLDEAKMAHGDISFNRRAKIKNLLRYTKLNLILNKSELILDKLGYEAKKIVNKNPLKPNAGWHIVDYKFLP